MRDLYDSSAFIIQNLWRKYCSKRIYKYYRDLILNSLKGAPSDLLRTVIPDEALLFSDRSVGVHVKFRLGGEVFPPAILFKVFIHQPLCDIGAFAPRDYANEKSADVLNKLKIAASIDSRKVTLQKIRVARYLDAKVNTSVSTDKWYKREENNPWRPILSNKLNEISKVPWEKKHPLNINHQSFHYNSLKRKEEIKKHRKQRKREWMMKAYMYASKINEIETSTDMFNEIEKMHKSSTLESNSNKILDANYEYKNSISNVNTCANDVPSLPDLKPHDWHGEDLFFSSSSQDEDLIKWSLTLDYDDYRDNWNKMATSMPSELGIVGTYSRR